MNIGSMFEREARRERLVEAISKGNKFSQGQRDTNVAATGDKSKKETDSATKDEGKTSVSDNQKAKKLLQKTEEDYFTAIRNVEKERSKYSDLPSFYDKNE